MSQLGLGWGGRYYQELDRRMRVLEQRMGTVATTTTAAAGTATAAANKRFRVGIFTTPLVQLGGQVSGTVTWSAPMPTAAYNVDAACSAMPATRWPFTTSAQTVDGVTITFTSPILLPLGTTVVVLAVSPATS